jgi:hypothetical protein
MGMGVKLSLSCAATGKAARTADRRMTLDRIPKANIRDTPNFEDT